MLLSVCIVVRDRAKYIAKTINSIKKLADEIIVIDIDSSDNTGTVASIMGARVYHLNETFSLCSGRNFARNKAHGKWILFLEANEELLDDYDQLRPMLRNSNQDGYYLPVTELEYVNRNNSFNKKTDSKFPIPRLSLRLYQNKADYKYNNDSHQSITNSILKLNGEASLKVLHLPIIRGCFYKFLPDEIRPLSLFYLEVDQDISLEERAFKYLKEGIKIFWKQEYTQAISKFNEGYLNVNGKYQPLMLKNLILILLEDRQYQRASSKVKLGLKKFKDHCIFKFWQGYLEYIKENYSVSIDIFKEIISGNFVDKDERILANSELFLGLSHIANDDMDQGGIYLEKARNYFTESRLIINILLEIKGFDWKEIDEYFQLNNPINKKLLFIICECLFYRKEYQFLEKLIDNQSIIKAEDNLILYWMGVLNFKQECYNVASQYFKKITPDFPYYNSVLHLQWILNLNMPGRIESKSVVNQIKLLGDKINWNLINFFNEIYFYNREVSFKFDNLVAKLKFYNRALYFLGRLIEYGSSKSIIIMLEIIESLKFRRSDGDIGLLFYIHGYWEQAYEYFNKYLNSVDSLPEVEIMSEVCRKLDKYTEKKKWDEMVELMDFYKEFNVHCRNFIVFVEY